MSPGNVAAGSKIEEQIMKSTIKIFAVLTFLGLTTGLSLANDLTTASIHSTQQSLSDSDALILKLRLQGEVDKGH